MVDGLAHYAEKVGDTQQKVTHDSKNGTQNRYNHYFPSY